MKFKGKVAEWFYAIMLLIAVILIPTIISTIRDKEIVDMIICLVMFILIELFFISIVLFNYVKLEDDYLLIVFGFIKKKIPYDDILTLCATNNPLSSLAASLDRIEIKCKNKSIVLISLVDKEIFFSEIRKKNFKIVIK